MFKRLLENESGLTLIELLAVVVILGIISAIAVPSIGGLIDNSKKDAHVANARQMINSSKLAVQSGSIIPASSTSVTKYIPLRYLEEKGYVEKLKNPDSGEYIRDTADANPAAAAIADSAPSGSYVKVVKDATNVYQYSAKLVNSTRGVQTAASNGEAVAEASLTRESIK